MYFITRIARDEDGIKGAWIRDTADDVEEYVRKEGLLKIVEKGIEVKGLNTENVMFSRPAPVVEPKMKVLKKVDMVVSKDGSEVQYLRCAGKSPVRLSELPHLGNCCIYGGGGTLVIDTLDRFNYNAFANYERRYTNIVWHEFNNDRSEYIDSYRLTLLLDLANVDEIMEFCDRFDPNYKVNEYAIDDVLTVEATTPVGNCAISLSRNVNLFESKTLSAFELVDGSFDTFFSECNNKTDLLEAIELFKKYALYSLKNINGGMMDFFDISDGSAEGIAEGTYEELTEEEDKNAKAEFDAIIEKMKAMPEKEWCTSNKLYKDCRDYVSKFGEFIAYSDSFSDYFPFLMYGFLLKDQEVSDYVVGITKNYIKLLDEEEEEE